MSWLLPLVLGYSVVLAVVYASRPAAIFLAALAGAAALPAGQVRLTLQLA